MMRTITKAAALAAVLIAITPAAAAATPQAIDLTQQFRAAGAGEVDRLQVYEIAGIVIIRGRVTDKVYAEQLNGIATNLGYARVANLVQTVEHDDTAIARRAEVELSVHPSLGGSRLSVTSLRGVVRVTGQVTHELQKDVASAVLRSIDGVRGVEMAVKKF